MDVRLWIHYFNTVGQSITLSVYQNVLRAARQNFPQGLRMAYFTMSLFFVLDVHGPVWFIALSSLDVFRFLYFGNLDFVFFYSSESSRVRYQVLMCWKDAKLRLRVISNEGKFP